MLKILQAFVVVLSTLLFNACSHKNEITQIEDVTHYSQDIKDYSSNFKTENIDFQDEFYALFKKQYFAPWHQEKLTVSPDEAQWGNMYVHQEVYGSNYKRLTKEWFNQQISNSNFEQFNQEVHKAITIKNTNVRVFPTTLPIFYNPKNQGEGFPFDYNQNSGIKINTPILISHFSKDKQWAYITTAYITGWISVDSLAIVDKTIIETFEQSQYYIAIKDNTPIYKNGFFKESIKLGTLLPKSKYGHFFVVNQYNNLSAYLQTVTIDQKSVTLNYLDFNASNIEKVIKELINEPYGWGEAYHNRDCSALTKDYFAAFGIALNRNSKAQIKNGRYIPLKSLNKKEKKETILKQAVPFLTLIYLKGHIMLYLGEKEAEPMVLHNVWGIKTSKESNYFGRFIIGKAVITTLSPGKELPHFIEENNILEKIEGMVLLNQLPVKLN
ncbi:MAG: SH3 domain-containing protein [Candidatus Marinarcus sp.]|uniref:SH3 domain-containing C40 family peptidase n=1 Tax=Candidatus Marinarcus sp. TaxID=3100987 RepID=UPI003AFF7D9D